MTNQHTETSPPTPLQKQRNKLLFGVQRSVRYHVRRRQFFDRLDFVAKFLLVISGGATVMVSFIPESHPLLAKIFGGCVALFAAIDLIVGSSKTAREHNDLANEFSVLQRQIILCGEDISEKQMAELKTQRLVIEEKEPPKLRVLDVLCHNELVKAQGKDLKHLVVVGTFQRLFADIIDILPDELEKSMSKKPVANIAQANPA